MPSALIVGSGPAAAGAALALSRRPDLHITVLDVGGGLDVPRRAAVDELAAVPPAAWSPATVDLISRQPVGSVSDGLPQKRSYGSDYPFHDFGQLDGVVADGRANASVVSGAYGGFSNVWGAQVMPFTPATFDDWPVSRAEMDPHYRAILEHIPFAAAHDDLEEMFPLLVEAKALPPLAPRSAMVLAAYRRRRGRIRPLGVTVGGARLAFDAGACVRCGLCMTGCPYRLVYSASRTFDDLRRQGRVEYRPGVLVHRVGQDAEGPLVFARDTASGAGLRFRADRVFVACGAIGTTRLVLGSLERPPDAVSLAESVQFVLPAASVRPTPDPRDATEFTLNQFNVVVALDDRGYDVSQIHFYPYNPAYFDALPPPLRSRLAGPLAAAVLRRLTVGLGYLPSWASPRIRVTPRPAPGDGALPGLTVSQDDDGLRPPMLADVVRRLWRIAPWIDLWPLTPRIIVSGGAKSYHFGGSFPHRRALRPSVAPTSDRLGRLAPWDRIHLVDASVFPSVPATTFTLTIMANAHRIADESMRLADG